MKTMTSNLSQTYLKQLDQYRQAGIATEHTYRAALQALLESALADDGVTVTNEPKQIACGAGPDETNAKDDGDLRS